MSESIAWYERNAAEVVHRYESVTAAEVHAWLLDLLPDAPALVLDIGAGTGRDAAWLASHRLEVIAVEPAAAMRSAGQQLHPSGAIRWVDDSLPGLDRIYRL